jgi:PPOX class probable F420-dependent enzyme
VPNKTNGRELHPMVLELARGQNFAALTTLLPSGQPQTQTMWVDADGEHLLVNTEVHRQKFRNVERDPRVTLMIWDKEDPYRFVEVRGEVAEKVKGPEARSPISNGCSCREREIHSRLWHESGSRRSARRGRQAPRWRRTPT